MFHRYFSALKSHPIRTNIATSIVVTMFGDVAAQSVELRKDQTRNSKVRYLDHIDWSRSATVTGYWTLTVPFRLHWFRWLDRNFVVSQTREGFLTLVKKITFHLSTFAPAINSFFYGWIILCRREDRDGKSILQQWKEKLKKDLLETQKSSVKLWGVAHIFNFLFLPTHTRVLFNSVVSVFWTIYISLMGHRDMQLSEDKISH